MADTNRKLVIAIGIGVMICAVLIQWIRGNNTTSDSSSSRQTPTWFAYMSDQGYITETDYSNLSHAELTRAEITPYLVIFGQKMGLDQDPTRSCEFADIGSDHQYYNAITQACQYGLMKGFGTKFLPDRTMKNYELITVLVRSQVGIIDQSIDPRYLPYLEQAQKIGILENKVGLDQLRGNVTIDTIGHHITMLMQQK